MSLSCLNFFSVSRCFRPETQTIADPTGPCEARLLHSGHSSPEPHLPPPSLITFSAPAVLLCFSLNVLCSCLPQGLCTCYSLCLDVIPAQPPAFFHSSPSASSALSSQLTLPFHREAGLTGPQSYVSYPLPFHHLELNIICGIIMMVVTHIGL